MAERGFEVYSGASELQYSGKSNGVFFFASVTLLAGATGELVYPELAGRKLSPVVYPINGGLNGFGPHSDYPIHVAKKFHMIEVDNSRGAIRYFYGQQGGWKANSYWQEDNAGLGASYLDIFVSGRYV